MAVHYDPSVPAVVVADVEVTDPAVVSEARRWSTGRRGPAVDAEELAGHDLTAFVHQALLVGAQAIATAGGTQEAVALESLITEVGERTSEASTQAATRTAEAITKATVGIAESTEAARKTLGEIVEQAQRRSAGDLETLQKTMLAELTRIFGGDSPELLARVQPVLDKVSRDLEERAVRQASELIAKAERQFDPSDPATPMGRQHQLLAEQHRQLKEEITRDGEKVRSMITDLAEAVRTTHAVAQARAAAVKVSPLKGEPFAQSVHRVMADVAAGLGDEYEDTSAITGRVPRSKKGDGVLTVQGGEVRVALEMTDSDRPRWAEYLDEAERNRAAVASLGIVRSADQNGGHSLLCLGPRRLVMAFDPETDEVDRLRVAVQLLRLTAQAAARDTASGEVRVAEEKLSEALTTLGRIEKITKAAGSVRQHANAIETESDKLRGELTRLLTQARIALGTGLDSSTDEGVTDAAA
ncbi:Fis family transcriptional regulator [Pseudonocardia acidicola]|uniref:Fis family transcriptional regulator n=1 Tax=Pseudonocardia acidicola TaxID=2724939 RepID=A0ABX1S8T8_9PSEU|nr:Fis family transcriptional regulator [Pseudonocardia acidicola]NMH97985.1 Fis family transcriptional regulator [Pseudonocardia acidicola]